MSTLGPVESSPSTLGCGTPREIGQVHGKIFSLSVTVGGGPWVPAPAKPTLARSSEWGGHGLSLYGV